MATYQQADRPLWVSISSIGPEDLLLVGFVGHEEISQLFSFDLQLIAENQTDIPFDKILGEGVMVALSMIDGKERYFNGICKSISQGPRDAAFTSYRMEVVPSFWLLTKRHQSRIFQQMTVPDILKKVLDGLDVKYEIQGTFDPRDYCVQYRESDFNFVSRLMEEEGIYYFFKHTDKGHTLVLANTSQSHPDMPIESKVIWEEITGGLQSDYRIQRWEKTQELRSGKYTLWDNCFELPDKHLEAEQPIIGAVQAGKVSHKLKFGQVDKLEIYEYPGEYAQRYDGVDPGGGARAGDLQKIFNDNKRTVGIRMQQESVPALVIRGEGVCRQFTTGHKFKLERHFNADGDYLLTAVDHVAQLGANYRSGEMVEFTYENRFICIPFDVPFRPQRINPKPRVFGTQTAIVVGPKGEEIFTDKYGRIKVQFPWDRQGKYDAGSSCWIRVAHPIAGVKWGSIYIPRIGQEVVVAFEEGDPDRPIAVGSVYNFGTMPPYTLPDEKTKTVFLKSDSSPHKPGFNEIRFEDKKGNEDFFMHAEADMDIRVKSDRREFIGHDRHLKVKRDKIDEIDGDQHNTTGGNFREKVGGDHHVEIGGEEALKIGKSLSLSITGDYAVKAGLSHSELTSEDYYHEIGGKLILKTGGSLNLKGPGGFIKIDQAGVWIKGNQVFINSGGAPDDDSAIEPYAPVSPAAAHIALNADPGDKTPTYKNQVASMSPLQQAVYNAPRHNSNAEENKNKKSWIEIELVDEEGNPVAGEPYVVTLPDGTTIDSGTLDLNGWKRIEHIDPGQCQVSFPNLDKDAVKFQKQLGPKQANA